MHEPLPLRAQGSTTALFLLWGSPTPWHAWCDLHLLILFIRRKETCILQPTGQPWCCLQPKDGIGEWALLLFSFWWLGFCCSRLTFFPNVLRYTSDEASYHLPINLLGLLSVSLGHCKYQEDGISCLFFTPVSPAPGTVPGTCKCSISICWINYMKTRFRDLMLIPFPQPYVPRGGKNMRRGERFDSWASENYEDPSLDGRMRFFSPLRLVAKSYVLCYNPCLF